MFNRINSILQNKTVVYQRHKYRKQVGRPLSPFSIKVAWVSLSAFFNTAATRSHASACLDAKYSKRRGSTSNWNARMSRKRTSAPRPWIVGA